MCILPVWGFKYVGHALESVVVSGESPMPLQTYFSSILCILLQEGRLQPSLALTFAVNPVTRTRSITKRKTTK